MSTFAIIFIGGGLLLLGCIVLVVITVRGGAK